MMVMSNIFCRISNSRELSLLYLNNAIWNIEKFGQEFHDLHATSWITNHKKVKICKKLIKLRFAKAILREKSTGNQFVKLNPREMFKRNDSPKKFHAKILLLKVYYPFLMALQFHKNLCFYIFFSRDLSLFSVL